MSPESLATTALTVATEAASLVLPGYRTRLAVSRKGRTDLVTEYDLKSEQWIRSRLDELAPGIPIVAEERGGTASAETCWFCDPLDGTTNFVHGHPFWCVSVGACERGQPVAGAVVAPVLGLSWVGWRGGSALRNGEPCGVSDTDAVDEAFVATGFPYGGREIAPSNNFQAFERVKKTVQAVRRCGSAAMDCCFVADGTYDAYWEPGVKPWDVAAGAAIVAAGGGNVSDIDGGPFSLAKGDILASNGRLQAALSRLILG